MKECLRFRGFGRREFGMCAVQVRCPSCRVVAAEYELDALEHIASISLQSAPVVAHHHADNWVADVDGR